MQNLKSPNSLALEDVDKTEVVGQGIGVDEEVTIRAGSDTRSVGGAINITCLVELLTNAVGSNALEVGRKKAILGRTEEPQSKKQRRAWPTC
jgi:hypothetical protein